MRELTKIHKLITQCDGYIIEEGDDGFAFQILCQNYSLCIIVSWGGDWDHVSVHGMDIADNNFTPSWKDMCVVKDVIFELTETVMQFHPSIEHYINIHSHVLHLWKPQESEILLPPTEMI